MTNLIKELNELAGGSRKPANLVKRLNEMADSSSKPAKIPKLASGIYKPLSALNVNQQYAIVDIRRAKTKYGEKVVVDLIDPEEAENIFCYLPTRVSKKLLTEDEAGLTEFLQQLQNSKMAMRRLAAMGTWMPVEFIIVLPVDPDVEDDVQQPKISTTTQDDAIQIPDFSLSDFLNFN